MKCLRLLLRGAGSLSFAGQGLVPVVAYRKNVGALGLSV